MTETILRRLYMFLVGLFLAAPLAVVAGVSVNEKQDLAFPPKGFSLSWYSEIFLNPEWRSALITSVLLALTAAAIAVAIALPLAWFLWRRVAPWANIFQLLGVAPFILPPVITALGFLTSGRQPAFTDRPGRQQSATAFSLSPCHWSRCHSASPRSTARSSKRRPRWEPTTARCRKPSSSR